MSRTARIIRNIALLALATFIFPMTAFASTAASSGNLTGSILSGPNMLSSIVVAVGAAILILGLSLGRRTGRRVPSPRRLR